MTLEGIPFGEGPWEVWGIPATERDDNSGLRHTEQDASKNSTVLYRTHDEEEARRLVREGGFERGGTFYATTHIVNGAAEANRQKIAAQSGVHPRQAPGIEAPIQTVDESSRALRKEDV